MNQSDVIRANYQLKARPEMCTGGQALGKSSVPSESAAQSIFTQVRELVEKSGALADRLGCTLIPIMREESNDLGICEPPCPVAVFPPLYHSLRDELYAINAHLNRIQGFIDRCDL